MTKVSEVTAHAELVGGGLTALHSHSGGGGEAEVIVVKSGDTANATTTLADATGLSFTALASKTYIIEAWVRWATSATTVGIKLAVNGPASPGFVGDVFIGVLSTGALSGSGGAAYDVGTATASALALADNLAKLFCLFRNGATQGTFIIRFAAEAAGTVTVKDGSVLRYRQVD